jgi:hypothetical protein
MKRKIQHNAVNNQEDEDSSTCPDCLMSDETSDNKENKPGENNATQFSSEASNNKEELTGKNKYL